MQDTTKLELLFNSLTKAKDQMTNNYVKKTTYRMKSSVRKIPTINIHTLVEV
jgi:hypothetical protein